MVENREDLLPIVDRSTLAKARSIFAAAEKNSAQPTSIKRSAMQAGYKAVLDHFAAIDRQFAVVISARLLFLNLLLRDRSVSRQIRHQHPEAGERLHDAMLGAAAISPASIDVDWYDRDAFLNAVAKELRS